MRVGILTDQLTRSGVTPIVLQEGLWIEKLGHTATTLVLRNRRNQMQLGQDTDHPLPTDIRYISETIPGPLRMSPKLPVFHNLSFGHFSYPILLSPEKLGKFDVLISHSTYTCLTGKYLARRNGIPYFPFIHDPMSYIILKSYSKSIIAPLLPVVEKLAFAVDEFILDGAAAVFTLSTLHSDFLRRIHPGKVYPIHPGCNAAPNISNERGTYLLAVKARWAAGTNAELMLRAISRLRGRATLVISGRWDPAYYKKILRQIRELAIQDRVRIVGLGTRRDLFELYRGARVVLACSTEAFGMMCIEGACFGCPFIIPEGSGVTDLFTHGVHGLFPRADDLETFVKYVDILISDERLSWKMGYEAWQRTRALTWENHAKKLLEIIEESS